MIARDKYRPDFFLYENNKSMSPAIREQITRELGVEPVLINSSLVSAQNRQRLYWVGKRNPDGTYSQIHIKQPDDKGILLRDILESGVCWKEKGYALLSTTGGVTAEDMIVRRQRNGAAEQIEIGKPLSDNEMDYMVRGTSHTRNHFDFGYWHDATKDKSACVTANIHKGVPYNVLAEPVRVGTIESDAKNKDFDSQQYRVYSPDGKSVTICGQGGGVGAKTGLYMVPTGAACRGRDDGVSYEIRDDQKSNSVIVGHQSRLVIESADGKVYPVYEVKDGLITIKDKQYPIRLADGHYIIRKLTVKECMRLQTVPETYEFPVSATQAYKMLGNGWTCDVISHLMGHMDGLTDEPIEVFSMYDGMSCGHIALDKLGCNVMKYYATEIDQYAIKTTQHNYPDTIQLGNAFQVREDNWCLPN